MGKQKQKQVFSFSFAVEMTSDKDENENTKENFVHCQKCGREFLHENTLKIHLKRKDSQL